MDIMVVTDVERNDVEFISRTLGCQPVAHPDTFTADKLGSAELCTEVRAAVTRGQKRCVGFAESHKSHTGFPSLEPPCPFYSSLFALNLVGHSPPRSVRSSTLPSRSCQ